MARKNGKDKGIFQRKDRPGWWVQIFHHGRARTYRCDSKSQAKALYGRLRSDIREETYFPEKFAAKQDITVAAWLRRVVDGSTNIGKGNETRYARRWSKWFGKRLLTDLSTDDLRHHQATMRSKMKPGTKMARQWRDSTINRHFAFLRRAFTLAIKDNKLARNPVAGVTFFPESNRTRFLSDEELTLLRNILAPEAWAWVALAIETGLRQGEQFSLQWKWVDLDNSVITIPMSKSGRTRHVPLSEGAKGILRSFDTFVRSPFVFPAVHDPLKPLNPDSFLEFIYQPALRRAGIAGSVWHSLRHTAASRRIMAGVDLVTVKEIMGHRDIKTTLRYSHLSPKHLMDGVNRGSLFANEPTIDARTLTPTTTKEERAEAVGL